MERMLGLFLAECSAQLAVLQVVEVVLSKFLQAKVRQAILLYPTRPNQMTKPTAAKKSLPKPEGSHTKLSCHPSCLLHRLPPRRCSVLQLKSVASSSGSCFFDGPTRGTASSSH